MTINIMTVDCLLELRHRFHDDQIQMVSAMDNIADVFTQILKDCKIPLTCIHRNGYMNCELLDLIIKLCGIDVIMYKMVQCCQNEHNTMTEAEEDIFNQRFCYEASWDAADHIILYVRHTHTVYASSMTWERMYRKIESTIRFSVPSCRCDCVNHDGNHQYAHDCVNARSLADWIPRYAC
jgi:hypothetical protein